MRNQLAHYRVLVAFILFPLYGLGQTSESFNSQPKKNAIFAEILSGPMIYSLNYQRVNFTNADKKLAFTYKVGGSYLPHYQSITFHSGIVLGKPNRSFEALMGLGYLAANDSKRIYIEGIDPTRNNLFITPQIGYRSQKASNNFLFRATLMPWIIVSPFVGSLRFTPGVGVSIGKAF